MPVHSAILLIVISRNNPDDASVYSIGDTILLHVLLLPSEAFGCKIFRRRMRGIIIHLERIFIQGSLRI